jgi:flotillin
MVIMMVGAMLATIILYALRYKKVPPNKAMVVYGRRAGPGGKGYRIYSGGGKFIMPVVEGDEYLSLNALPINLEYKNLEIDPKKSKARVNLKVSVVVKIASDPASLDTAAEQLMGKSEDEIAKMATDIIDAHVKGIIIISDPNKIKIDRDAVAERIQNMAAKDLRNLGIEVRTIVINDIVVKS